MSLIKGSAQFEDKALKRSDPNLLNPHLASFDIVSLIEFIHSITM
jgi:hypothetical protein